MIRISRLIKINMTEQNKSESSESGLAIGFEYL